MNVELTINLIQLIVASISSVCLGVNYIKYKTKQNFLGLGFVFAFMLGILYWFSYQLLISVTPQYFYVSDISWVASTLFLLALVLNASTEEERERYYIVSYIPILVGICLTWYFSQWGDVILNALYVLPLAMCVHIAMNSLMYAHYRNEVSKYKKFYWFIIIFTITEYLLWISSCFWISDTFTNPYFWIDIAVTIELGVFAYLIYEVREYD